MTSFTVLIGAPQSHSALRAAALHAAEALLPPTGISDPVEVVDLASFGSALLAADPGEEVTAALGRVRASDVVLVVSPQVHGSYTGLLKVFLDRIPEVGLGHTIAVPMAVVDDLRTGRGVEDDLRVLLSDLGARVIEPGLLLARDELGDPAGVIAAWSEVAAPTLRQATVVSV
ncbi:FMN reductase [Marinactinospora thermotolerans DSM 45154]|uniref:FMN reductase n=1 Tax=Marinactinospora thermotolerans DSM 45154 TaxID=1122192 RepID=A0A1T4QI04_9ACTN|nr:NAD(P)H-dependent oxidoreductase [Marinactinospora thermotolerans]SKA03276.1 FMN reductase [Marinactinospora thermotolerans DSM 45154]